MCAANGDQNIQYRIGSWYESGIHESIPKNVKEAVYWYKMCDAKGDKVL